MKRVKAACICQTLRFMLKEDLNYDDAVKAVRDEVEKYKAGDTITVAFYRNDKINSVDLVLGDAAETGKGADTQSENSDTYDPYEEFRRYYYGFGF